MAGRSFLPAFGVAALLAAAAAAQPQSPPQLQPAPQEADRYRALCRERPEACTGSYERDRDRLLREEHERIQRQQREGELLRQGSERR
jgi:hypothetical protein